MRTVQEESKRSIHSLRIDTVLGDPTPIKPRSVLPINPIDRPKVEDPEYLPDTVASLAACLSALARLVPSEKVQEIYRTIRDIIDRIAPVTQTSLDQLETINESIKLASGKTRELTDVEKRAVSKDLESQAGTIVGAIENKIRHYKAIGTNLALTKASDLTRFVKRLVTSFKLLEHIERLKKEAKPKDDLDQLEKMRLKALESFQELIIEYGEIKEDQKTSIDKEINLNPSKSTQRIIEQDIPLTSIHKHEILSAFEQRIVTLQAAGDSFDISVANAVKARKKAVNDLLEKDKTFTISVYNEITKNNGDLSQFRVELTPKGKTDFEVHMEPLFFPGKIRAIQADPEEEVEYDPLSSALPATKKKDNKESAYLPSDRETTNMQTIASSEYVQVYRRFLQMFDGTEVEILPDVRIDFDLIKEDFIDYASHDLKSQSIESPDEVAEKFYEQNKIFIIQDALNPDKGAREYLYRTNVRFDPGKSRSEDTSTEKKYLKKNTPERAALVLANEKIKDYAELIKKAPSLNEENVEAYVRSEAIKQLSSGMTKEKVTDKITSLSLRIREDEIRRIINTAAASLSVKKESDAEFNRDVADNIKKKVIDAFNKTVTILPGSPPVPAGDVVKLKEELIQSAKESFKMCATKSISDLAKANIQNLTSEESAGITDSDVKNADAKIKEASEKALTAASALDNSGNKEVKMGIEGSLAESIGQICAGRIELIEAMRTKVENITEDYLSDEYKTFTDASKSALSSLEAAKESAASLSKDDSATPKATALEKIVNIFVAISRLMLDVDGNKTGTGADIEKIFDDSTSHDVGRSVREAVNLYSKNKPEGPSTALLSSDAITEPLTSHVARIMADLLGAEAYTSEKAKERYGIPPENLNFPLVLRPGTREDLKSEIAAGELSVITPDICDVLFGSDGIGESIALAAEKITESNSDDAVVNVIIRLVSTAADAAMIDIRSEFKNPKSFRVVHSVVDIACIALQISQSQKSEDAVQYLSAVRDIVRAGQTAPTILSRHLFNSNENTTRAISVDMSEIDTGIFVDIEGRPIARVVASSNPASNPSSDVAFIDPDLEKKFLKTMTQSVSSIVNITNSAGNKRVEDLIRQEVRNYLIDILIKIASDTSNSRVVNPQSLKVSKLFHATSTSSSDEAVLTEKVKEWQAIARRDSSTPYAKSLAKAAINYVILTGGKNPIDEVPYFTPIRRDHSIDSETGEKVLKTGYDFVFRTLTLSEMALSPRIQDMPQNITETFFKKITDLVDMHVLTVVGDAFNERLREYTPPSDKVSPRSRTKKSPEDNFWSHMMMMPTQAGETTVRRSPAILSKCQVLTIDSVINEGIPTRSSESHNAKSTLESLVESAESVVIRLMLDSSGYLASGVKPEEAKKNIDSTIENRSRVLNKKANDLIERVIEYVVKKVTEVTGQLTAYKVKDLAGKESEILLTDKELKSLGARMSRGQIIKKIGAEHYFAIQQKGPVALETDPATGTPLMPPSPKTFFNEQMSGSNELRLTDPWTYARKAAAAVEAYNKILASQGLIISSSSSRLEAVNDLSREFPYVFDKAQEISRKRLTDRKMPKFENLQDIKVETNSDGSIAAVNNMTSITSNYTSQLLNDVKKADSSIASETSWSSAPGKREIAEDIQALKTNIESLVRVQENLEKLPVKTAIFNSPLLVNFIVGYSRSVSIYARVTSSIEEFVQNEIKSLNEEITPDALNEAKDEAIALLKSENKMDKVKLLKEIVSRIVPANETSSTGERLKARSISSISGDALDELEARYKTFETNMTNARESANRLLQKVEDSIDRDIEAKAKKSASFVAARSNAKNVKIDPASIVDTENDLEMLFENLKNEKIKDLTSVSASRTKNINVEDRKTLDMNIEQVAMDYAKSMLMGKIFGVRFLDSGKKVTS